MAKRRSKAERKQREPAITPEKARTALVMTAREYIQTKEYKTEARERGEKLLASITSDLKPFQEMVRMVARQLQNSGVLKQLQYVQQEYAKLLKNFEITHSVTFYKRYDPPTKPHLSPEDIEKIARRSAYYLMHIKQNTGTDFPIQFVLASDGDLYRQSNPVLRYRMRDEALRLKILQTLIGKSSYYSSRDIMNDVHNLSYGSLTKAIAAINTKARSAFKLSGGKKHNLIISKSYSGYMINPLYAIRYE